eukprot:SAG22_NODE_946_length_6371_cov_12.683833_3_plen_232_part_00
MAADRQDSAMRSAHLVHLVVGAVDGRPEDDGRVGVVGLDRADVVPGGDGSDHRLDLGQVQRVRPCPALLALWPVVRWELDGGPTSVQPAVSNTWRSQSQWDGLQQLRRTHLPVGVEAPARPDRLVEPVVVFVLALRQQPVVLAVLVVVVRLARQHQARIGRRDLEGPGRVLLPHQQQLAVAVNVLRLQPGGRLGLGAEVILSRQQRAINRKQHAQIEKVSTLTRSSGRSGR